MKISYKKTIVEIMSLVIIVPLYCLASLIFFAIEKIKALL